MLVFKPRHSQEKQNSYVTPSLPLGYVATSCGAICNDESDEDSAVVAPSFLPEMCQNMDVPAAPRTTSGCLGPPAGTPKNGVLCQAERNSCLGDEIC